MNNLFVEIVRKASELRWCTRPYCTTCGNREVRTELRNIAGKNGFQLADILSALKPAEIVTLPNWQDCVQLAFFEISLPGTQEKVLESWLPEIDNQIHFADVVLYYVIRTLPFRESVGKNWIERCIALSNTSRNESLVESLLFVLGRKSEAYPDFLSFARQFESSPKIQKALRKAMS